MRSWITLVLGYTFDHALHSKKRTIKLSEHDVCCHHRVHIIVLWLQIITRYSTASTRV